MNRTALFTVLILGMAGMAAAQLETPTRANPVPQLLKHLDSLDENVGANAAHSLGVIFKSKDTNRDQLQEVVDKLIEKMNTSKWTRVRLECIAALGEIRSSKAVDPLKETVLNNKNLTIATAAGKALSKVLHVDAARELFKSLGAEENENVQRVAYSVMVDLATQEDVGFLVTGIDSANWRIQVDAVRGLERSARHGARFAGEVYTKVASVLGNEILNVSDAAANFLVHVRSTESMNTLIAAADTKGDGATGDVSWRTRANALKALNRIRFPGNIQALPAIIRQLDDPTANVIREAKNALAQVRSNHGFFRTTPEQVAQIAQRYLYPRFLDELEKAESLGLRVNIIREMGTGSVPGNLAGRVAGTAARSLDEAIAAGNAELRNQSLELLGAAGSTGVESATTTALAALQAALETRGDGSTSDPSWRVRAPALAAVKRIGYPRNRTVIPHVIRQLDDGTANVQNEARDILNQIRRHPPNVPVLFELLLTELTTEPAPPVQLKAKILREMGAEIPTQAASEVSRIASEALADAMGKPEQWEMRAGAVTVLGGTATTGDIQLIAQCVGDDTPTVRQAAGDSLARLSEFCEPTETATAISTLLPLIEKSVDWRKAAIAARALGSYPTPDATDALVRMTGHSVINVKESSSLALVDFVKSGDGTLSDDVETKIQAAMKADEAKWEYGAPVLGALEKESSLPILLTILQGGEWRAQVNAIHAILEVHKKNPVKDKAISDALIKCTLSGVRQVHEAANQALRVITPEE